MNDVADFRTDHVRIIISHRRMACLSNIWNPVRSSGCSLGEIGGIDQPFHELRLGIRIMQRSIGKLCSCVEFGDESRRGQDCCVEYWWGWLVVPFALKSFGFIAMPGDIGVTSGILESITVVLALLGNGFVQDFFGLSKLEGRGVLTFMEMR